MKVAILTLGSRGDLQPFIALGLGLKNVGYDVLLISSKNEESFAKSFGLDFYTLDVDVQKLMEGEDIQKMAKSDNPLKFITSHLKSSKILKEKMVAVFGEIWEACQNSDAIIYHPGMQIGYFIAKELNIPSILASPFPATSTKDYPSILFYSGVRLGKIYNQLTHFIFDKVFWAMSKSAVKEFWNTEIKTKIDLSVSALKRQESSGMPIIYGYSEHLFERPEEWAENIQITGSWTIYDEPNWTPPDELVSFIKDGTPPVYIGFGSIKDVSKFNETFKILVEALKISGQRGIIVLGWNKLDEAQTLPENVYLLDNAPHSWLFPQMSVVVHHGGAGTTAAGLNAGKPTVIIPHSADQPAWGKRVYELGVGAKPIPKAKLTAVKLADAINEALNPKIVENAERLGNNLRKENGVETATQIIDKFLTKNGDTKS
jgi:sterol 3beta-glucosyltransferase